jgi:hypothetical protein
LESLFVLPCPVATLEKWQLRLWVLCKWSCKLPPPPKQTPSKIYSHLHQGTSTKCSYSFWRDLLGSQVWQAWNLTEVFFRAFNPRVRGTPAVVSRVWTTFAQ